jgi:hypothetical protein
MESTIIERFILKGKEKKTISNLQKGAYMYEIFKNDESIEQGKITVK